MSMDELLNFYEQKQGVKAADAEKDFANAAGANIASEVNLLKQASQANMEVALKREASLAHGTKIDQYMDVDACEVLERRVEKSK